MLFHDSLMSYVDIYRQQENLFHFLLTHDCGVRAASEYVNSGRPSLGSRFQSEETHLHFRPQCK